MNPAPKDKTPIFESTVWKLTMVILNLLVIVIGTGLGFLFNAGLTEMRSVAEAVRVNTSRLAVLETSAITSKDAKDIDAAVNTLGMENQRDHAYIRESLLTIAAAVPKEIPPKWFEMQVSALERKVDVLIAQSEKRNSTYWTRYAMQAWASEFKRLNPEATLPVITVTTEDP